MSEKIRPFVSRIPCLINNLVRGSGADFAVAFEAVVGGEVSRA